VEQAASGSAPVRRLLVWYASTRLARLIVRHLPHGTGSAVDAALVAMLGLLASHALPPTKE
jgi:hypothetical protein